MELRAGLSVMAGKYRRINRLAAKDLAIAAEAG